MDIKNPGDTYKDIIERNKSILPRLKRQHLYISLMRLFVFAGGGILIYFAFSMTSLIGFSALVIIISVFLFLVYLSDSYTKKITFCQNIIRINSDEIRSLDGDFSGFNGGSDLNDPQHDYSSDIDLFGDNSLFQFLNRTVTGIGREYLAGWLTQPYSIKDLIKERQEVISELSARLKWRQEFMSIGIDKALNENEIKSLTDWLEDKDTVFSSLPFRIVSFILPAMVITALLLSSLGIVPFSVFTLLFIINLFLTVMVIKKTNMIHEKVSRKHLFLSSFGQMIRTFGKENFSSALLVEIRNRICNSEHSAAREIGELNSIIKAFDSRLNLFVGFILNGLVLWDFHCIVRLEKWRRTEAGYLPVWLRSIGEVDAFISLANYAFNNPEYSFPLPDSAGMVIESSSLGHPLLKKDARICNDFKVVRPGMVYIITGANMAGKSTFLRAVAVNMVLAMTGAPVCALKMSFRPVRLFTSMRTTDSLSAHESYFYAELKRLRGLKERLGRGEDIFFILDEILKGTNSVDKSIGSRKFMQRVLDLGGTGMIATHDLSLGVLQDEYPDRVVNKCFEIEIDGENIKFDYILRDGMTTKMNAAILMKQMGIA
jgi:hypothetical protein